MNFESHSEFFPSTASLYLPPFSLRNRAGWSCSENHIRHSEESKSKPNPTAATEPSLLTSEHKCVFPWAFALIGMNQAVVKAGSPDADGDVTGHTVCGTFVQNIWDESVWFCLDHGVTESWSHGVTESWFPDLLWLTFSKADLFLTDIFSLWKQWKYISYSGVKTG